MSVESIDHYLRSPKRLAGIADWWAGNGHEDQRIKWAVTIQHENHGDLTITWFPNSPVERFKIVLALPPAIWRIDYDPNDRHPNPLSTIPALPRGIILGSHFHAWEDNRHLMKGNMPPPRLRFARPLPADISGLHACLRWFCQHVNIALDGTTVPPPPSADRLL
ncbi:hypothetical protein [Skermanella stibiiresistens]|uniref:hypothetical protein n=1 Tax=Skermanella stibiiresistens TaxID=913326 RepID=UPI0012F87257|nr:hypothetical protein [Skermanella stibiiresistens]